MEVAVSDVDVDDGVRHDLRQIQCDTLRAATLRSLQQNDPNFTGLLVDESNWINGAGNWINGAGPAIGDSKFLRKLQIKIISGEKEGRWLGELLQHPRYNRSIEGLCIYLQPNTSEESPSRHNYELEWDIFHILTPFIDNLHEIIICGGTSSMLSSLTLALSNCKNKRLERINLWGIETGSDFGRMFASLTAFNNLVEIHVCESNIGSMGCMVLSELLQNPTSKIHTLGLNGTTLDGDCITTLSISLIRNNSVKLLDMRIGSKSKVSSTGWATFCEVFSHPMCTIENLWLDEIELDHEGVTNLVDALAVNTSLKYLSLNEPLPLERLRGVAQCLRNPNSSLEKLDLFYCDINDEGVAVLIQAVQGNLSLKRLLLEGNIVTKRGLMVIFNSLLNGGLTLEVLDLRENDINFDALTEEDWRVLTRALCDNSSIGSTFCSNHVLRSIGLDMFEFDEDADNWRNEIVCHLESSLIMNRNPNKGEVARQKILKHHFAGEESDVCVFTCMPETVLPNAIEWIGRSRGTLTYSIMFHVVQSVPALFNITNKPTIQGAKKRKLSSSL